MYDLSNLNDYEFELLCKDIMEKTLGINLLSFCKGKDGGIDLCDDSNNPNIIVQCKHYIKSGYSKLYSSLKSEIPKISNINFNHYYVCCSISLTPKNRNDIYELFKEKMDNAKFIIDSNDINAFLKIEDNLDIVKRNYKLWFCADSILSIIYNKNIFIDCDELAREIDEARQFFVYTKQYKECEMLLEKKNIIIITGDPGTGKSTISKMLLLNYADKGYIIKQSSSNDINDLKKVLSQNPENKEILLLDDFLGQHYLDVKSNKPKEIKSLLSYIANNENKKIILNSRITILNEAVLSSVEYSNLFEKYERDKYYIDLNKTSLLDKAKILYNYLYFNYLDQNYLSYIAKGNTYLSIVKHANYNPRIIEYVTKERNYRSIKPEDYGKYILSKLNNPEDVWEDEYRNRISEIDRIYLNTLYSITNNRASYDSFERAFNKRIGSKENTSINQFLDVTKRCNGSLIKLYVDDSNSFRYVSVVNPSLNDFLRNKILNNPLEIKAITENACFIDQIYKLESKIDSEVVYKNFINGHFDELDSIEENEKPVSFLMMLAERNIKDDKITNSVKKNFNDFCKMQNHVLYEEVLYMLIENDFIEFYSLHQLIINNIEDMTHNLSYDFAVYFIGWIDKNIPTLNLANNNLVQDNISSILDSKIEDDIYNYADDIINNHIDEVVIYKMLNRDNKYEVKDEIRQRYFGEITQDLIEKMDDIKFDLYQKLDINNNLFEYKKSDVLIDIEDLINSYIDTIYEVKYGEENESEENSEENEIEIIKHIFSRFVVE